MFEGNLQETSYKKRSIFKKGHKRKKNVSFIALQKGKKVPKLSFHMNDVEIKKSQIHYLLLLFARLVCNKLEEGKILPYYSCFHSFLLSNSIFKKFWYKKGEYDEREEKKYSTDDPGAQLSYPTHSPHRASSNLNT